MWHQVKGKVKEVAEKVGSNQDREAEGKNKSEIGEVEEKIGAIKLENHPILAKQAVRRIRAWK